MAAKDYEFACGMNTAYLAKKKKTKSNLMSEDRRPITEGEILMLVDFSVMNYCKEHECNGLAIDSLMWHGKRLEIKFVDKDGTES